MALPTLLVGVWGDPGGWREAEYRVRLGDEAVEKRSKTSLEPLAELLRPSKTLIIASDTLAEPRGSYEKIRQAVVEKLYDWVSGNTDTLKSGKLSIVVAPNVGFYHGCRWGFEAGLDPFDTIKSVVLVRLYEELVDLTMEAPRARLVLDTTHGVNYMTVASFEAALDAARLAALTTGATIDILVYNSEPYPRGASDTPILEIHAVYTGAADPTAAVETAAHLIHRSVTRSGVRVKVVGSPEKLAPLLGPINTDARLLVEDGGVPAAVAILYAMPLAAAYLAAECSYDVDYAVEVVRDALDAFHAYTVVEESPCRVTHQAGLEYSGVYAVLASAALLRHVRRAYIRAIGDEAPCRLEDLEDRGVYLDELPEIAARLYTPSSIFASKEAWSISSQLEGCKCSGAGRPQCSSEPQVPVYCEDWPGEQCKTPDLRNLLAHAGLEWNAIEATIDQSGVAVRYREGCWEQVKKLLKSAARAWLTSA